jgi:hypothetical protein
MIVFVWGLVAGVLVCIAFVMAVKGLTALQIAILYSPLPGEDEKGKRHPTRRNSDTARLSDVASPANEMNEKREILT